MLIDLNIQSLVLTEFILLHLFLKILLAVLPCCKVLSKNKQNKKSKKLESIERLFMYKISVVNINLVQCSAIKCTEYIKILIWLFFLIALYVAETFSLSYSVLIHRQSATQYLWQMENCRENTKCIPFQLAELIYLSFYMHAAFKEKRCVATRVIRQRSVLM